MRRLTRRLTRRALLVTVVVRQQPIRASVIPLREGAAYLSNKVLQTLADRKVDVYEAVQFCQDAFLNHSTVVPGYSTEGLSDEETARWGWFDCKNHFCELDPVPGCVPTDYARALDGKAGQRRRCVGDSNASLTVLTTMPYVVGDSSDDDVSRHVFETLLAIGENARSPYVRRIHVLVDRLLFREEEDNTLRRKKRRAQEEETSSSLSAVPSAAAAAADVDDSSPSAALRRAVAQQQARYRTLFDGGTDVGKAELRKIDVAVYGRQPTYADMFRYANANLNGTLVALTNADVVLRNLHRLDAAAFEPRPGARRLAFALSVHPPNGTYGRLCKPTSRCVRGQGSWDTHVFRAPLPDTARWEWLDAVEPNPVYMNMMGAENRVGIFLHASGYDLRNPCFDLIAEHWHCSPKTHHNNVLVWDWLKTPHLRLPGHIVDPSRSDRGILDDEC